ncbi:nucleolar protein 12 [Colletotrichum scovillei]|uniref:Nucleolar protein 12 n=1 Tax=Colletotrichum scovillei TaxID=1209932 RepID=A0A9P7RJB2_9PEZI|nr:nucleolar protein 12 [Colletotrichum scovillei]KAF4779463.1 nucleolar protein 12 [Colletotrichum scovillei]KAG7058035.1 nucleolar protein 12 [Colletotrichum scovillei]KAG7076632.1 nucleolar protein 12 [Colletotrichum scovillei]KAG7083741.1 nucleolar protein 12 [Colletotrichum scovillei]
MFAKPRPKKSVLSAPPSKKRKAVSAIEEVNFDFDAREDYLTGFHKRKLQRQKWAQEQAASKAREEKIEMRKQIRQERQREVEDHVNAVSALLKEAQEADSDGNQEINGSDFEEWDGIDEPAKDQTDIVDYEDEYIDEDRYTSVKVEAISVTRDGLEKIHQDGDEEENDSQDEFKADKQASDQPAKSKNRKECPKKQKKKFTYETKLERSLGARKAKAKKARFKKE